MKGVFLHVMADTFGSVGIIISTLLIKSYGWMGFDLISSIFIAVLMRVRFVRRSGRSSDNLGLDPPATEGDELGK